MKEAPIDQLLRLAALRAYGTPCSQSHCKALCECRMVDTGGEVKAERDPEDDGTWITVRVFVADADVPEVGS